MPPIHVSLIAPCTISLSFHRCKLWQPRFGNLLINTFRTTWDFKMLTRVNLRWFLSFWLPHLAHFSCQSYTKSVTTTRWGDWWLWKQNSIDILKPYWSLISYSYCYNNNNGLHRNWDYTLYIFLLNRTKITCKCVIPIPSNSLCPMLLVVTEQFYVAVSDISTRPLAQASVKSVGRVQILDHSPVWRVQFSSLRNYLSIKMKNVFTIHFGKKIL